MSQAANLAELARLLSDRTRAELCLALLDGRAWTAGELARHANVAPSTASEHLDRLVAGGLVVERRQGRHRYLQLAGPPVAGLLEDLVAHQGMTRAPERSLPRSLRAETRAAALARGRTCYDHLAGRLGVVITDAMTARGLLDRDTGVALTGAGLSWLTGALGISEDRLRTGTRPVVRECLDWTERRSHLAGAAGARLCERLFGLAWITRVGGGRAVRVTTKGERALADHLGITAADLTTPRVVPSRH